MLFCLNDRKKISHHAGISVSNYKHGVRKGSILIIFLDSWEYSLILYETQKVVISKRLVAMWNLKQYQWMFFGYHFIKINWSSLQFEQIF